ncbi:MAG TPA: hypothetical protein VHY30_10005 [Verrucomicrobiae bacterium]|jgi:hypothetical protein|nr:hypothetical protein [Verrucomicrobiae bacterium]
MKLKLKRRIIFVGKTKRTRRLVQVTLVSLFAVARMTEAQSVIAPPPSVVVTPPAMQSAPNEMQVFKPESPLSTFLDEVQPLQWGPVTLRPHVFYQFTYGTGVQSSPGQQHDTVVQELAPGVLFILSPHWTLDYTPTFTFYSGNSFENNVGQSVSLNGGTTYGDWTLGLSQNFTYSSSPQVQTGTQTSQQTYSTSLSASHSLNSKMSVDLGISQNLNFPSGFQSTLEWSTMDWLNYEFWPRLTAGVGAGAGYVEATPNTVFEQLQARVNWRATDKTSFGINGGPQFTQFTEGGAKPLINPTFGASIQYLPFQHTQLSLSANEAVNNSYYQNQVSTTTSVGANLSQRLLEKFYLSLGGSYSWEKYTAVANGVSANSSSDYYSLNVSLSTTFLKRVSASVFYSYSDNITSQSGLAFSSSQIGFNLGYKY